MAVRWTIGLLWALLSAAAGGWLVLAPWALGEQSGSKWTTVTDNEIGTGLGLIVLALVCVAVLARQTASTLRQTGGVRPRREALAQQRPTAGADSEMEQALIRLATALSADLERGQPGGQQPPLPRPGPELREERE
jgi:hypothetical protein